MAPDAVADGVAELTQTVLLAGQVLGRSHRGRLQGLSHEDREQLDRQSIQPTGRELVAVGLHRQALAG